MQAADLVLTLLPTALVSLAQLLCMRSAPFVFYVLLGARFDATSKLLVAAAYIVLSAVVWSWVGVGATRSVLVLYAYLAVLCAVVHLLAVHTHQRTPAIRLSFFCLAMSTFVFVPAFGVVQHRLFASVVGWEMAFSAYSVFVEAPRQPSRPSAGDVLFFLMVDPVLVFSQRGQRSTVGRRWGTGMRRVLLGVFGLLLGGGLLPAALSAAGSLPRDILGLWLAGAASFLTLYAAHSGLASLQIGLMRWIGWEVPERYHYPILADGPADFWRRWNIYLGTWLRLYLYLPTLRRLRYAGVSTASAGAAAVMVTFCVIGALHGVGPGENVQTAAHNALMFAAFGAVVIGWQWLPPCGRGHVSGGKLARGLRRTMLLVTICSLVALRSALTFHTVGQR